MDRKFEQELLQKAEKYACSPWGKEALERRLGELSTACSDSEAEALFAVLNTSEDKAELDRASGKLRALADQAIDGLRRAAAILPARSEEAEKLLKAFIYIRERIAAPWIDRGDIAKAVTGMGVREGQILLVHSSYTRLGHVIGGAQAVVDGLLDAVGPEGTLVMPTLSQKNFETAYRDWTPDRPSDVGYLTEFFRKLPGVERSDQATHSVAAFGKLAHELTKEHGAYGPRLCLFGVTAFSHSSPWQKMYDIGGKVLFLGAKANTNTFKHLIECCQVERRLDAIEDPAIRAELADGLWTFDDYSKVVAGETYKAWPMYKSIPVTEVLDAEGYVNHGKVGDAELLCMDIQTMVREVTRILESDLARWYPDNVVRWFNRADAEIEKQTQKGRDGR